MTLSLDDLERLHAEATPGPWRRWADIADEGVGNMWVEGLPLGAVAVGTRNGVGALGDAVAAGTNGRHADLIVAAVNALPSLIATAREAETLRARVTMLESVVKMLLRTGDGAHGEDCAAHESGCPDADLADIECTCGAYKSREKARRALAGQTTP